MIGLLRTIEERGARASRHSMLAFFGAGLVLLACGFASAALVEWLSLFIPRYAALGGIGAALLAVGGVCLARAGDHASAPAPAAPPAALLAQAAPKSSDWRAALKLALVEDARDRPARAAALAGLILGVMEGLQTESGGGEE